jgi:hypothetical protein
MAKSLEELRVYQREYAQKRRASDPVFLEKCREAGRKSRLKRQETARQEASNWKAANKEKVSEYNKKYSLDNAEQLKQKRSTHLKNRRKIDPLFVLIRRERCRVYEVLKGKRKSAKTENLIGCSYQEFKDYIESLFIDGMGWHNMGLWHIDHIQPLSSFDLSDSEQQKIAFNYKNQQPLWAEENMKKGAKYG